jgi:hypothetical protein
MDVRAQALARAGLRLRKIIPTRLAAALGAGIVLALIGALVPVTTEALGDPSKYRDDPIPYCLSYIASNETCDRDSKDSPWVCTPVRRDMVQASSTRWDEASILKFCHGWTDK